MVRVNHAWSNRHLNIMYSKHRILVRLGVFYFGLGVLLR